MASRPVREVEATCPYCGARFRVPETASIVVCPYCGTAFWRETGGILKEHYMYPDRLGPNEAYRRAMMAGERLAGAPGDLLERSSLEAAALHYVPLYLYRVRVYADCPGKEAAGYEDTWVSLLATKTLPYGVPLEYDYPARGRRFFEPRRLRHGYYYRPEADPGELAKAASREAARRALAEARLACREPRLRDDTRWVGIVHYPFWAITYRYGKKKYRAVVDASSGDTVYLEYPVTAARRLAMTGTAVLVAGGSGLVGAGTGVALGATVLGKYLRFLQHVGGPHMVLEVMAGVGLFGGLLAGGYLAARILGGAFAGMRIYRALPKARSQAAVVSLE